MSATAPKGLGTKSRKLWRQITTEFALRADELRILEEACREVDTVERLQEAIDAEDFSLITRGSQGQDVANPLLGEIRQHRAILARLLAALRLPDAEEEAGQSRSSAARSLAQARWGTRGA